MFWDMHFSFSKQKSSSAGTGREQLFPIINKNLGLFIKMMEIKLWATSCDRNFYFNPKKLFKLRSIINMKNKNSNLETKFPKYKKIYPS